MNGQSSSWAFYFLQGEDGEDHSHPNAFKVYHEPSETICLRHFANNFPLRGLGNFHFRFRVSGKKGFLWLDVTDANATLPLLNGKIISKVLRLDKPAIRGFRLRRKAKTLVDAGNENLPPRPKSKQSSSEERPLSSAPLHRTLSAPERSGPQIKQGSYTESSHSTPGTGGTPARTQSGNELHGSKSQVPKHTPQLAAKQGTEESLDDFLSGGSSRPATSSLSSGGPADFISWQTSSSASHNPLDPLSKRKPKAVQPPNSDTSNQAVNRARSPVTVNRPPPSTQDGGQTVGPVTKAEMEAVHCGSYDGTAVWNPDKVDLSTKSDKVAEAIQERMNEKQARLEAAKQELRERETQQQQLEQEKDQVKQRLDPVLKGWAYDGGKLKNIRALLSSMHTVMWKDSKWTEVGMAKLLTPADVKKAYRRAVLVVHPDRAGGRTSEQLFIAERVFDAINGAFELFEKQENAK